MSHNLINTAVEQIGKVLLGKDNQVKLALACLFAKGHLLIEDLPGMGKTTLAHCLANVLGLQYDRVQFTSDLLPADILGVSVFDRNTSTFNFHPGPVFTQLLLADEINRSTPKTQSALLEAMEEGQVTIDGQTRLLPNPFFVIATQNPMHQSGTFPLPESQLDRFLMCLSLGYPSAQAEKALYQGVDARSLLAELGPVLNLNQLQALQQQTANVTVSDSLADYLQRLVAHTRYDGDFDYGVSPRGALAWLKAAKAWAVLAGREYVVPEDLQAVALPVVAHRVRGKESSVQLVERLLTSIDVMA